MSNGLDAIDQAAEGRKRGRSPGGSRNPRSNKDKAAEEERRRLEQLEEQRKARAAKAAAEAEREQREEQGQAPEEDSAPAEPDPEPTGGSARRSRPPSIPFYYDPDNEAFLWEIAQAAVARRAKVPASAVLRLAMRRLQDQMPVERIVQELGGPSPSTGRKGRPRR